MKSKVHEAYWRIISSEVYEEEALELIAFVDMINDGKRPDIDTVNETVEAVLDSLKNTKYLDDAKIIVSDMLDELHMNLLDRLTRDEKERARLERQVEQLKAKIALLNKIIESYEEELNGKCV